MERFKKYHNWYARLLRLYPKHYYERFGQGMEQTFSDLLREHSENKTASSSLLPLVLWIFLETTVEIIKKNLTFNPMKNNILRALSFSTIFLLIPFIASRYVDGWNWSGFDFIFAWVIFSLVSLALTFAIRSARSKAYKLAMSLAVVTAFCLVWGNAAVGFIGEQNLANTMFVLVPLTGIIGSIIVRLKPHGMMHALLATALMQALIPIVAIIFWPPSVISWAPGVFRVFLLDAAFVVAWLVSAMLFRYAAKKQVAA